MLEGTGWTCMDRAVRARRGWTGAARRDASKNVDGAWWVGCAALRSAVSTGGGSEEWECPRRGASPMEAILEYLAPKRCSWVDNCEH